MRLQRSRRKWTVISDLLRFTPFYRLLLRVEPFFTSRCSTFPTPKAPNSRIPHPAEGSGMALMALLALSATILSAAVVGWMPSQNKYWFGVVHPTNRQPLVTLVNPYCAGLLMTWLNTELTSKGIIQPWAEAGKIRVKLLPLEWFFSWLYGFLVFFR